MSKIICFSGFIGSGKSTLANYCVGRALKRANKIYDFSIDESGKLIVLTPSDEYEGAMVTGDLQLQSHDPAHNQLLAEQVWPTARICSMSEFLKNFCVHTLDIEPHKIYGTHEQKLELTQYTWRQMPIPPGKKTTPRPPDQTLDDQMNARDVQKYWGNDIFRGIDPLFHFNKVIGAIEFYNPEEAYIDSVRYPNEADAFLERGAKVIRLTKKNSEDDHESENALNADVYDWTNFSAVLDNASLTLQETLVEFEKILQGWGL